ncbi:MAG: DNA polymerase [Comamonadaceae bacterium]|nr:DNA polymerase [Comamonadaceae bacterium]
MNIYTIDFETHWASGYSLSHSTALEYVKDSRFQIITCAIRHPDGRTTVHTGEKESAQALAAIDWSRSALLAHNGSGFDAYVAAYHFGIHPRLWLCTLAMARPLHAKTCGLSLGALVEHYRLGVKDNTALVQTRGKRLEDFTPAELDAMRRYNQADVEQCWQLYQKLLPHYSSAELWQIDAITRMRVQPQFELDVALLERTAREEAQRKHQHLLELAHTLGIEAGVDEAATVEAVRARLASAPKFAALLKQLGEAVPMKPSPTNPDKTVPALAKTDEAFIALQDSANPQVAAAARARLDVKATLLETRIQKLLTAARLAGGRLPIPLKYCGADTTGRDSGEDYNPQNLPRINPDAPKPTDALRLSLRAPAGKRIIVADQSGIELRVNHFLWQVASSMALYQASPDKADLYKAFAADLYGKPVEAITKAERQIGKISQLGLGFGAGAAAFQRIAKIMGGVDIPLHIDDAPDTLSAEAIVLTWRHSYAAITQGWKQCQRALEHIAKGVAAPVDPWGLVTTSREGLTLPSGRLIRYPDLRTEADGHWDDGRPKRGWAYAQGRHKAWLTGPKVCENIVQALARDSIFDCAVEYYRRTGLRPALRVHDELVYVVDEAAADALLAELQAILRTPPTWWPELIVWSEGDSAASYGQAK